MALSLQQYKSRGVYGDKMKDVLIERLDRQRELSMGFSAENGDRIPNHLIIEILSYLPVKALLQFKSVSKLWYSIIRSSHFISKHMKNYYDNDNNWHDCLIIQYYATEVNEVEVYEVFLNDKGTGILSHQLLDIPVHNAYICGPCDGIYFIWGRPHKYSRPSNGLWNPALNEFVRLPDMILRPNLPSYLTTSNQGYGFGFGFGIDYKMKDYKVIIIQGHCDSRDEAPEYSNHPLSLFIYSLKSNTWRYWGDLKNSYHLRRNLSYVFVNGCCYWLGCSRPYGYDYKAIISFDITRDVYEEISLPKSDIDPYSGSQLFVYYDSLAFVYVPSPSRGTKFSIWTWSVGVWTLNLIVEPGFQVWGPFSHLRDNLFLFRNLRRFNLLLRDIETSEIWVLDEPRAGFGYEGIIVYKESLVSIKDIMMNDDHDMV